MNLILLGGALLAALLSGPGFTGATVETRTPTALQRPVGQPAEAEPAPAQKTAQAPVGAADDRGWMTRELSVDRKTGETTEINVIGFAD